VIVLAGDANENGDVKIVPYAARYAAAFKALNEAWITRTFRLEAADLKVLDAPDSTLIAPGGHIVVALSGDEVVGVCALQKAGGDTFELVKMAVTPGMQGRGVGRRLGEAAIAWARARGARRIYLESNTKLDGALALYRKLGFEPFAGPPSPYERVDIHMQLWLR
jgi:GNAT superfamily N-acetyltransferase